MGTHLKSLKSNLQKNLEKSANGSSKHLVHPSPTMRKRQPRLPSFRNPQWCHPKVQHEHLSTILPRIRRENRIPKARLNTIQRILERGCTTNFLFSKYFLLVNNLCSQQINFVLKKTIS